MKDEKEVVRRRVFVRVNSKVRVWCVLGIGKRLGWLKL